MKCSYPSLILLVLADGTVTPVPYADEDSPEFDRSRCDRMAATQIANAYNIKQCPSCLTYQPKAAHTCLTCKGLRARVHGGDRETKFALSQGAPIVAELGLHDRR